MSLCCPHCFQVDSPHGADLHVCVSSPTQGQVYSCWQVPVGLQCRVW